MKDRIRAIYFDMDGTIIDSESVAARVIAETFLKWGISIDPNDAHYVTGRKWEVAFQALFSKYQVPVSETEAISAILDAYRESLATTLIPVPGVVESIRKLAEEFPLALVSGSHRREILWALGKLGVERHFQVILGAEDYPHSKPHPVGFEKAADLLGEDTRNGLVFEDSPAGIASGRSAGMWVTAVTGAHSQPLDVSGAHWSIRDFKGVSPEWVRKLKHDGKK